MYRTHGLFRDYRQEWKEKLSKETSLYIILDGFCRQLEQSDQTEKNFPEAARTQAKKYSEIKHFEDLSEFGFISVATVSAMLKTPFRFANKKGLDVCWVGHNN